ncbi:hypothetical protein DAI18_18235 [Microvirgula aerodenitrificans]|uniref:Holliday junction resolvase n=2 Tax=Microvirgula aerodenitrificans TaxID=57480 RepID=A0A2S0PEI8_9NEIS|nr:hypothetical protein DAI18_18235 [Microvirgula aerodenitrificans]
MTGRMSRDKGARGERELAGLLAERLGISIQRRLGAARDGGHDIDVPGWAVESKRTEVFAEAYWRQAQQQAEVTGCRPVLFWRASRRPWVAYVDLHDVSPAAFPVRGRHRCTMTMDDWCQLAREVAA